MLLDLQNNSILGNNKQQKQITQVNHKGNPGRKAMGLQHRTQVKKFEQEQIDVLENTAKVTELVCEH